MNNWKRRWRSWQLICRSSKKKLLPQVHPVTVFFVSLYYASGSSPAFLLGLVPSLLPFHFPLPFLPFPSPSLPFPSFPCPYPKIKLRALGSAVSSPVDPGGAQPTNTFWCNWRSKFRKYVNKLACSQHMPINIYAHLYCVGVPGPLFGYGPVPSVFWSFPWVLSHF